MVNENEDLNCADYQDMTDIWKKQLQSAGWCRTWSPDIDGPAFCATPSSEPMSLYDAWIQMTGNPKDFNRK
jgi:hypothetical protein